MTRINEYIYVLFRGDHIVPNFEEIWPSNKDKDSKYKRNQIGKKNLPNGPAGEQGQRLPNPRGIKLVRKTSLKEQPGNKDKDFQIQEESNW